MIPTFTSLRKNLDVGLLPQGIDPALLSLGAFLLDEILFDLVANVTDRLDRGVSFRLDHDDVIGVLDGNRPGSPRPGRSENATLVSFSLRVLRSTQPQSPPACWVVSSSEYILRHAIKLGALGDLLANLLGEFPLAAHVRNVAG